MADRPILFSASMTRALLAGTKTQTRRVLRPPYGIFEWTSLEWRPIPTKVFRGDRLWVRESWRTDKSFDHVKPSDVDHWIRYEADGRTQGIMIPMAHGKLRPSIFMPRWASRLTLTVTDVKVERLLDISDNDAWAEGVCQFVEDSDPVNWDDLSSQDRRRLVCTTYGEPMQAYRHLWETINGPLAWDENPWVAAYTFTVHHLNIDALPAPDGDGR